jgi:hypothetical protein
MKSRNSIHGKIDRVAATASFFCLCHCIFSPIIISVLPLLGLAFLADYRIEMTFISLSLLLAMSSLCWGVRKHKNFYVPAIGAIGFGLLAVGHMFEGNVIGICGLVFGGLSICASHLINYRLCESCSRCTH